MQAMKKARQILKPFLALMIFLQGTSLVATCAVPCHMKAAEKLHCVVGSLLSCQQESHGRSIASYAMACGHLEWKSPVSAVAVPRAELQAPLGAVIRPALPSLDAAAQPLKAHFMRAGPAGPGSVQALLAVPPQNAPPVLA